MSFFQRSLDHPDSVATGLLARVRNEAAALSFAPRGAVRCVGLPMFRTPMARDVGCLLDLDPSVISWICLPMVLGRRNRRHVPAFTSLANAPPRAPPTKRHLRRLDGDDNEQQF